jgi:hypothetical protein
MHHEKVGVLARQAHDHDSQRGLHGHNSQRGAHDHDSQRPLLTIPPGPGWSPLGWALGPVLST